MKKGILALAFVSFLSCMPEEELPMKDMGDIPVISSSVTANRESSTP